VIAFVLVLLNSFLSTREECGTRDENEEHDALFVLPLLLLLSLLLLFTVKKMLVFFFLVFVFVRIKVCAFRVVAKPLLVEKEVIARRERE